MSHQKKEKKKGGKRHRKNDRVMPMMRSVQSKRGFPTEMFADLVFHKRDRLDNPGGANANFSFQVTDVLNVDFAQAGSTTNVAGFISYANLYRQMRTESAQIVVDFGNLEDFPIAINIVPVNKAVSKNDAGYDVFFDQPSCIHQICGALTGDGTRRLRGLWSTKVFAGAADRKDPDTYTGNTDYGAGTHRPLNNWYIVVGASTNSNFSANKCCMVDITITMRVRFFEMNDPTS